MAKNRQKRWEQLLSVSTQISILNVAESKFCLKDIRNLGFIYQLQKILLPNPHKGRRWMGLELRMGCPPTGVWGRTTQVINSRIPKTSSPVALHSGYFSKIYDLSPKSPTFQKIFKEFRNICIINISKIIRKSMNTYTSSNMNLYIPFYQEKMMQLAYLGFDYSHMLNFNR